MQGIVVVDVACVVPGMKGQLKTGGSRDAKVVEQTLHLGRIMPSDAGGPDEAEEPDRGDQRPLHVEHQVRACSNSVVLDSKVDPDRQMGLVATREAPLKGGEELPGCDRRLAGGGARRVRRQRRELSQ